MSTTSVQRKIGTRDLEFPGYLRAPHPAKATALGLWLHTDGLGRRELVPELIAAAIYPGEAATETVIQHLMLLDASGFLSIYDAEGLEWIELLHPLKVDARLAWSNCPEPPREHSRTFAAVGGGRGRESAGAWAERRVRAEGAERAGAWAEWADAQERTARAPVRPLLLDAPPIGCPEHPHGKFGDCGPCGTARRRHDRWVAERRHVQRVADFDGPGEDDEPF